MRVTGNTDIARAAGISSITVIAAPWPEDPVKTKLVERANEYLAEARAKQRAMTYSPGSYFCNLLEARSNEIIRELGRRFVDRR